MSLIRRLNRRSLVKRSLPRFSSLPPLLPLSYLSPLSLLPFSSPSPPSLLSSLLHNLLLLGLLKLLPQFPQPAVLEALAVCGRGPDGHHVIRVVCRTREGLLQGVGVRGGVYVRVCMSSAEWSSPKPDSSCTLILWTCRLVGMNSSFLSAFRLLALNQGPGGGGEIDRDSVVRSVNG